MRRTRFISAALAASVPSATFIAAAFAGPYTEAGIPGTDPRFGGFATAATVVRGPQDIATPGGALASVGDANSAVGAPGGTFDVVSLGDGGTATLTFARPIRDGIGADFAVFENAFGTPAQLFAELAYVDVSSDGANFVRFAATSLTPTSTQVDTFGTIDATDVFNLAGKHVAGTGTGFDLAGLRDASPLLDVERVTHVRVVDVVGIVNSPLARLDASGRAINDPYATPFASGGFDLDAVGAINVVVPEPAAALALLGLAGVARRRGRG